MAGPFLQATSIGAAVGRAAPFEGCVFPELEETRKRNRGDRRGVSACIGTRVDDQDGTDARLVLAGDVDAFEGIVARWQGPLFQLALRFCHDRGEAEDLTQEAFLRAFRSLASWRADSKLSTWLIALATNVYRSYTRRAPREAARLDEVGLASAQREDSASAEELRVRRAVDSLPARYRDAIALYYFHALDVSAAAKSLRIPEGTLKARLSRGRKLLEGMLATAPSSGGKP
jgi:RNA polymerase sigma-70 factor (ECF subfamily)